MNNLLERLHASFFFYILTSPEQFLKIGLYLPSAILISVALMIKGLSTWVEAASTISDAQEKATHIVKTPRRRKRPIVTALSIVIGTHVSGALLFAIISSSWFLGNYEVFIYSTPSDVNANMDSSSFFHPLSLPHLQQYRSYSLFYPHTQGKIPHQRSRFSRQLTYVLHLR